jgi:hypothetical protein
VIGPYGTPEAFRAALEARLRNIALQRGADLQRLQRRVAFDRLLARLFVQDDPPWLLKGGYALELRLVDRARSTLDLDLSVPDPERLPLLGSAQDRASHAAAIHQYLQQATELDLSDGFEFVIPEPQVIRVRTPVAAVRFSVESRLAGRPFARFRLDVGFGDVVLDQPDWVQGTPLLSFAGIAAARVALYPVAQHFAEKIHAYTFPWQDRDNTRVKDLVDLVLLVSSGLLAPGGVKRALRATFETRDTHPFPEQLPRPPLGWAEPYAALSKELGLPALTLMDAYTYLEAVWQKWGLRQLGSHTVEGREQ